MPLSRWSCPELAREAMVRGIAAFVSASTVRRWLVQDAIKPWLHRSWIFITDPDFRPKAARVLDLYARTWNGEPLGEDEYVISADEKTSIQARCRCHPTLAPGQARAMRVNHTYGRGGALAYLAAYDIHQATVFGRTEPTTGIAPFMTLVARVMSREPYASAKRVFWVVDNGQRTTDNDTAVPVEVHHLRPGRSAGQARPAHRRSPRRILRRADSMINPRRISGADHLGGLHQEASPRSPRARPSAPDHTPRPRRTELVVSGVARPGPSSPPTARARSGPSAPRARAATVPSWRPSRSPIPAPSRHRELKRH